MIVLGRGEYIPKTSYDNAVLACMTKKSYESFVKNIAISVFGMMTLRNTFIERRQEDESIQSKESKGKDALNPKNHW